MVSPELANLGRLKELELDIRYRTAFFLEQLKDLVRGELAVGPFLQLDEKRPVVRAPALAQDLVTSPRCSG